MAPSISARTIVEEGLPFNSYYLIEFDGIFQNQEEIDTSPVHPFNPKPGDLKFKDQNGDNKIDADDRVVVDGAYPSFYYGGNINLSWKNFDLTPRGIINQLKLRRPIYKKTAAYGHFGREDSDFTWEQTDKAVILKKAL